MLQLPQLQGQWHSLRYHDLWGVQGSLRHWAQGLLQGGWHDSSITVHLYFSFWDSLFWIWGWFLLFSPAPYVLFSPAPYVSKVTWSGSFNTQCHNKLDCFNLYIKWILCLRCQLLPWHEIVQWSYLLWVLLCNASCHRTSRRTPFRDSETLKGRIGYTWSSRSSTGFHLSK